MTKDANGLQDVPLAQLSELRASEAMFRGLLEAAPDAVVVVGVDGRILLVNTQTERLFGYSRSQLIGERVEILVPERFRAEDSPHRGGHFTHVPDSQIPAVELMGLRKNGTEFPVEISLSPLETERGTVISTAIRDMTDRKRAEEHRFRLAAIVDSSDDAIIGKTLVGIITSWNEGAYRVFGYRADEVIGKSITLLLPRDRLDEERLILEKLGRGERVHHLETVRIRKDGQRIDVSVTSSPVRDSSGNIVGASKIARDITERRRAAEALERAKEAADAANSELEAFSYSVAHDLRAPLRGMNGFARVLLDTYESKLDAQGQDWLQEILLNAKKMGLLIDALLGLARLTRREPKHERTDLSTLAHAALAELAAREPDRKVDVVVEDELWAHVDPTLARATVQNLLGNAWKFTSKLPHATIEFGATETQAGRSFFVRDNGAGFDMAFAGKLFAPFQRLHTVDEFPGTGIGLATVQRIIRRHGGRVWAEGAVDAGATFYFTLPPPADQEAFPLGVAP